MVQATHELSRLLDRLEDIAEPQGAIGLASINTSLGALQLKKAEKLPGSAESPRPTLQGVIPSPDSSTDSSALRIGAWRPEVNAMGQEAISKVAEPVDAASECPQTTEADSREIFCKAMEEGCTAITLQLRQALLGDGKEKQH